MLDNVVHGDNTRMVEPTSRTSLSDTAGARQLLLRQWDLGGEQNFLNSNIAAQDLVVSAPDNAHRTATDRFSQAVTSAEDLIRPPMHD